MIRQILNFSLVFLSIYGPKLTIIGFDFIGFACVVALVIYHKHIGQAIYTTPMLFGALATAYVIAILLFNGVIDIWWLGRMPRYLLNIGACFVLTYAMNIRGRGIDLLAYIFFASVLHSSIVIAQVLSPDVNAYLIRMLDNAHQSEIRFSGLVRGLAHPSFVMAASIGIGYYCYAKSCIGLRVLILGSVLIFLASLVMGRAGLYLGVIATFLAFSYDQIYKGHVVRLVVFYMLTISALGIFVLSIDELPLDPLTISALKHGLEFLFNYLRSGEFSSSSMADFEQHKFLFHNDTFIQYLIGTGLYGRGDASTYLPTDIAYAHMFSAFGIVGLLLLSGSTLSMLVISRRAIKEHRYLLVLTFFLIVCTFILNYKETTLLTRHVTSLLAFLWATLHFSSFHRARRARQ